MAQAPFHQNVIILTGATSGIGAEMARQLADQGAWLALAARRPDVLEQVAQEVRTRGGRAICVPTDVSDPAQARTLVERTVTEYGRIDTLVNNAGIGMWSYIEDLKVLDVYERIMRTNYLGSVYPTYYALPHLKAARGRLVAISSVAALTGVPARSGYSASKHAQNGFFESLRIELMGSGVSVTIVMPAYVSSGFHTRITSADGTPMGSRHNINYQKAMSTGRCARLSIRAMAARRRGLVMTPRARLGQWVRLFAPAITDRLVLKVTQRGA